MPTKRVSERLTWLAFALAAAASAIAQEPRQWLERMNQALTSRNYDGVFAHWQDGRVEMLRIIHRNVNGQVTERLASLDGSGREFIRNGAELSCYLPDKRTVLVSHSASSASLLTSIPAIDKFDRVLLEKAYHQAQASAAQQGKSGNREIVGGMLSGSTAPSGGT